MSSARTLRSRAHPRRSPQVDASSSSTIESSSTPSATASAAVSSATSPLSATHLNSLSPTALRAIIAVIVVFAVLVTGYALYRWVQWRRDSKQIAASTLVAQKLDGEKSTRGNTVSYLDLENGVLRTQQPNKAVILPLAPPSPDTNVGWVPQIKPWMPQARATASSSKPSLSIAYGLSEKEKEAQADAELQEVQTPPPVYVGDQPPSFSLDALAPTPAPATTLPSLHLNVDVPPDATNALPSPRTASMQKSPVSKHQSKRFSVANMGFISSKGKNKSPQSPRLVTVETEFQPSMDDELAIRLGEVLHLLEEYEDGWCLVRRVAGREPDTGVVPLLCVVEKRMNSRTTHTQQAPSYSSFASASSQPGGVVGKF